MVNLVSMLILVSMARIVSLNYVKLYTDKVVTFAATTTSQTRSSIECAVACKLNHPCVSYAFNPARAQCLLYDRVIEQADPTSVDVGIKTFTYEFGDDNIASHKPTVQSSTWQIFTSSLGVDGNKTNYFHTDRNAWWCVDLMAVCEMKWLVMYNRIQSASIRSRINGFEIWLATSGGCTDAGYNTSTLCYRDTSNTPLNIYTINNCSEANTQFDARYVFIHNPDAFLHLREVEIVPWGCQP